MKRRGYAQEYQAKTMLIKMYGKENVIKVAVSQQAPDFICWRWYGDTYLAYLVFAYEIKSCHRRIHKNMQIRYIPKEKVEELTFKEGFFGDRKRLRQIIANWLNGGEQDE